MAEGSPYLMGRCGEVEDLGADPGRDRSTMWHKLCWVELGQDCGTGTVQDCRTPYRDSYSAQKGNSKRAPRREGIGEALACLGDLAQLHTGEFLVQRTLNGGSRLGVFYSPRVCLT